MPGGDPGIEDSRGALGGEAWGGCQAAASGGAARALPEAQAGARSEPVSTTGAAVLSAPAAQSSQRAGADEARHGAKSGVPAKCAAQAAAGASVRGDTDAVDSHSSHREGAGTGGAGSEQGGRRGAAEPPAAEPSSACATPEHSPGADTRDLQGCEGGRAFDDPLGVRGSGEVGFVHAGSGHGDGAAAHAGPPVFASPDAKAGAGARAVPEADAAQGAAEHEVMTASPGALPFLDVHARAGDAGHVSPGAPGAAARPAGPDAGHLSAQGSPREVRRIFEVLRTEDSAVGSRPAWLCLVRLRCAARLTEAGSLAPVCAEQPLSGPLIPWMCLASVKYMCPIDAVKTHGSEEVWRQSKADHMLECCQECAAPQCSDMSSWDNRRGGGRLMHVVLQS